MNNTVPLISDTIYYIISAVLVLGVLLGIYLMSKVNSSVKGNTISAVSMVLAIITVLLKYEVFSAQQLIFVVLGLAIGSVIGLIISKKVKMIQMPQVVALLNGFGGGASAIVGAVTIAKSGFEKVTSVLAVVVGTVTLIGSLVAASKLQGIISPRPKVYKGHKLITTCTLILSIVACILPLFIRDKVISVIILVFAIVVAALFGYFFSIRVGGADMPITISLLNSFSGVAGSIAGLAIGDALLVAIGGIVGASGLILTQIMCRAMNRHLFDILLGKTSVTAKPAPVANKTESEDNKTETEQVVDKKITPAEEAADILKDAKNIIIIPGYGMALGQAQSLVKQLSDKLEANGANVRFAIHPVA
ncbi:MAG: NAD(P)(+) transhydrogenase (Re/Si-specific) subunit beta, partial [Clostridia bacterium]|nr:NAD(P)(+) transhydrogenase (Re/Si-specific) subunit beta [Clostridia bacterium]